MIEWLLAVAAVAPPVSPDLPPEAPATVIDAPAAEPVPPLVEPPPAVLPPPVRAMIDAAIASGDPATIATILRLARQTNPIAVAQIDALAAEQTARQAEKAARAAREKADALAAASFLDNWKGEVELGGSRATGNSQTTALYGAGKASREGIAWRHAVSARFDLQSTNGVTSTERAIAAWQPNYKFDERLFAYGLAQFERDRFAGYSARYTGGGGIGYTAISGPTLKLDVQGGPAVRRIERTAGDDETRIAARASLALKWAVSPTLALTNDSAVYYETGGGNASSNTALDTRLLGALKARLSYSIQYERAAPIGREELDTISRATLVYSF